MGDGGTLHGRAAHETVGTGRGQVIKTTWPDKSIPYSLDRGKRQFIADRPNQLGVADFTDVSTWHSWRVSTRMHTDFMPDALEHALYVRQPESGSMIHSSDRGLLHVSIRYTEWLGEAGVEPSVGSRGDRYDNALAETVNGLYKIELIYKRGPWKNRESVELATLKWVS